MVKVRTIEGSKIEHFTYYNDALKTAKKMVKLYDGVVTIQDNLKGKVYVIK